MILAPADHRIQLIIFSGHPQNCWSETGSCVSESASTTILPNHLKRLEPRRNNMETSSQIVPSGRKSYNNIKTTHYGLIDWPNSTNNGDSGLKSPNILMNRKNSSHDSGVDSMNTNSSGMYIYSLLDNAHVHVPSLRIANFFFPKNDKKNFK